MKLMALILISVSVTACGTTAEQWTNVDLTPMQGLANQWTNATPRRPVQQQQSYTVHKQTPEYFGPGQAPSRYNIRNNQTGESNECHWQDGGINAFGVEQPSKLICD